MAFVTSVSKYTVTIPAGTSTVSENITVTNIGSCVPFVSVRVTTPNSGALNYHSVYAQLETGPDRVSLSTALNTTRVLEVEITVVEFDPTYVKVQSGTFTDTGLSANPVVAPDDVVVANTFIYHTFQIDATVTEYDSAQVRANIFGVDNFQFSRMNVVGNFLGTFWLVEAIGGTPAFTVQHIDLNMSNTEQSQTASITSVDMDKTFLLGSWKGASATNDNAEHTVNRKLDSEVQISCSRKSDLDAHWGSVQVITFDSGEAVNVQRGDVTAQGATASQSIDITAVGDLGTSMVHTAGTTGCFTSGSFPGADAADCPDAACAWDFVDEDTIRVQHHTGGVEADNDISWEVIEWDVPAPAASRRVMVIS